MTSVYDEVELEDLEWSPEERTFFYPCPCGDRFQISLVSLCPFVEILFYSSNHLRFRPVPHLEFWDPRKTDLTIG